MADGFVTRFAPSPTGYLHLGHAFSALTAHAAAREAGGRFLLRIEDIDFTRCRPQYEAAIVEDLVWLGLEWDAPARRQSDHMAQYHAVVQDLRRRGLVYRCFKTRREVMEAMASAPHGPEVPYRGAPMPPDEEERRLAAGEAYAWRLSLDAARAELGDRAWESLSFEEKGERVRAEPERAGDVVLARKDTGVAYHLAVVFDDDLQGVTDIIRGEDLAEAAHIQALIWRLIGRGPQPRYRHHSLILGEDGKRLAKRDHAATLRELREAGIGPAEVRRRLGF